MSWNDYGIPGTLSPRQWYEVLGDALLEKRKTIIYQNDSLIYPRDRLVDNDTFRSRTERYLQEQIEPLHFIDIGKFDPLATLDPATVEIPWWGTTAAMLETLGEEKFDVFGKLNRKHDRRFWMQQKRLLDLMRWYFPDGAGAGKLSIRKRRVRQPFSGASSLRSGFQSANHFDGNYDDGDFYGYDQPRTNVGSSSGYYDEDAGSWAGGVEFFQIMVDSHDWDVNAQVHAYFYGYTFGNDIQRVSCWETITAMEHGIARIDATSPARNEALWSKMRDEDRGFGITCLGCLFDFKVDGGFRYI